MEAALGVYAVGVMVIGLLGAMIQDELNRRVLGIALFWPVVILVKAAQGAWEVCRD